MKKLILFLAAAVIFTACDKEKGNGRLDPNAMISLRAAKAPKAAAETRNPEHLTPLEIVEQTHTIVFVNTIMYPGHSELSRGFTASLRDYANERLLMWGSDIIEDNGELNYVFIGGQDVVLRRIVNLEKDIVDTIAYIPNATLQAAYVAVRAAYEKEDYTTVYKLFDEAFTFSPITGEEWRELKAAGDN